MTRVVRLGLRQIGYENRAFRRNPVAAFFTLAFPLMFLFILNLVFGNNEVTVPAGTTYLSTSYIPMIVAFSVINSSYTNMAMSLAIMRDNGILKRLRGTPLPPSSFMLGKIMHNTLISTFLVVVVVLTGVFIFDVTLPMRSMPAFLATLILGAATFSCLGIAVTSIIPNADAAPAVVNATVLPLLFISDVFIPMDNAPDWLNAIAQVFPVRPFSLALQDSFDPFSNGTAFDLLNLSIMGLWMILGLVSALKFFSWQPKK